MDQSTSNNSISSINQKFRKLLAKDVLQDGLADARICNNIAVSLYDLRAQAGLTQQQLADKIGVKQSNISRWEQPGYQGYKVKVLNRVVRALGGTLEVKIFRPATNVLMHIDYLEANLTCRGRAAFASRHDNKKTAAVDMLEVYREVINITPSKRRIHA